MLLRSASTPILKSWIPAAAAAAKEAPHEVAVSTDSFVPKIPRVCSNNSLSSSCPSPAASYSATSNSAKKLTRAMSDNISDCLIHPPSPPVPKRKPKPRGMIPASFSISLEEETKIDATAAKNLSSNLCLLDEDCSRGRATAPVVDDEGCVGDGNCNIHGNGGNICGSGGQGKGSSDSNSNDNSTDAYYQKMIQANPANSLVLGNYAKFLKEVRGDVAKAQEYCERAILADQRDSDALSMYGEIMWEQSKDAQRAETYFDRAIQAAPDDCYVMASYARFIWDAEEEEEENQVKNDITESVNRTTPSLFPGAAPPSSVAAAS